MTSLTTWSGARMAMALVALVALVALIVLVSLGLSVTSRASAIAPPSLLSEPLDASVLALNVVSDISEPALAEDRLPDLGGLPPGSTARLDEARLLGEQGGATFYVLPGRAGEICYVRTGGSAFTQSNVSCGSAADFSKEGMLGSEITTQEDGSVGSVSLYGVLPDGYDDTVSFGSADGEFTVKAANNFFSFPASSAQLDTLRGAGLTVTARGAAGSLGLRMPLDPQDL